MAMALKNQESRDFSPDVGEIRRTITPSCRCRVEAVWLFRGSAIGARGNWPPCANFGISIYRRAGAKARRDLLRKSTPSRRTIRLREVAFIFMTDDQP